MTILSEVLSGIQTLKEIGKHLEEISRFLYINNGNLFIAVTAFKTNSPKYCAAMATDHFLESS